MSTCLAIQKTDSKRCGNPGKYNGYCGIHKKWASKEKVTSPKLQTTSRKPPITSQKLQPTSPKIQKLTYDTYLLDLIPKMPESLAKLINEYTDDDIKYILKDKKFLKELKIMESEYDLIVLPYENKVVSYYRFPDKKINYIKVHKINQKLMHNNIEELDTRIASLKIFLTHEFNTAKNLTVDTKVGFEEWEMKFILDNKDSKTPYSYRLLYALKTMNKTVCLNYIISHSYLHFVNTLKFGFELIPDLNVNFVTNYDFLTDVDNRDNSESEPEHEYSDSD